MDAEDRPRFSQAFRRMTNAFRVRLKGDALDELELTYFKILSAARIDDVLEAGKVCLATRRTFPKAAEWLQALPAGDDSASDKPDVRVMSTEEASEYLRAERLRYEDTPCDCLSCQIAAVTHLPRRFVPDVTDDGRDERAVCQAKNAIVTVGHWAHGEELLRWYAARDAFYAQGGATFLKPNRLGFTYVPPPNAPRAPGRVLAYAGGRVPGEDDE